MNDFLKMKQVYLVGYIQHRVKINICHLVCNNTS